MTLLRTNERTNELRTNTMNTTTTIRPNIFSRSCNDDYCPAMEDLCVKMSKLSLQSDPKMEAYDAKLEQSFYEEKFEIEDNEIDEKNEETFGYNDETDYEAEVNEFNTRYGTYFSIKDLDIFNAYVEHTGLTIKDALKYNQVCHTCGDDLDQLNEFGSEYCNDHCRDEFGEGPHRECFHGNSCLICHGYPETTCYWAQKGCDRCDAYEGPEEDRYPYSCFHCDNQMTDHEGYIIDDDLYCNNCAVDLFDKTEHLDNQDNDYQDNDDSKKRPRDPESDDEESDSNRQRLNEKKTRDRMSALTDESCDIWDLALDITQSVTAALQLIEDQPRLRAHPRVIEYYRAKEASNEDMDFEECSSECSSLDECLQQRKRARHTHFETDSEDEAVEPMVIDLVNNDCDEDAGSVIDLLSQDDSDYYDYAESVVDDDDDYQEPAQNSVMMAQNTVSTMVTMIQELRDENAALRDELEQLRSQRRMLFPEGSSISFTDENGRRYLNVHPPSPSGNHSHMSLDELECDDNEDASEDGANFPMDQSE